MTAVGGAQAGSLNVIGDWIYYSNLNDSEKIYRITTGGLYDELVCDVENACSLSIAGGWIYFIQYAGQGDQWTVVDTYKVTAGRHGTDAGQTVSARSDAEWQSIAYKPPRPAARFQLRWQTNLLPYARGCGAV